MFRLFGLLLTGFVIFYPQAFIFQMILVENAEYV